MNSMGVRAALAFLLLFIATVKAGKGGVTFSGKQFEMHCPEPGNWFNETGGSIASNKLSYELFYDDKAKGLYHCKYNETAGKNKTYYFYVKGKVCENCFELDPAVFGWTLAGDVVATACVMAIIYRCTKKKRSAGLTHTSKAPARPGGRPPPVQAPDYEQLSAHTRSQDPYSTVSRMG